MPPTTYANEPRNGVFSNRIVEWILGISTGKDDCQKYQKIANLVFFQRSKTHVLGGFFRTHCIRGICSAGLLNYPRVYTSYGQISGYDFACRTRNSIPMRQFSEQSRQLMDRILKKYPPTNVIRTKAEIIGDLKAKKLSIERVWHCLCV